MYSREVLGQGVYLCRDCHRAVHRFFDEMTLARDYNTLDSLKADGQIQRHVAWVSRQKIR